jgi:predicted transcriptional regulator
MDIDELLKSLDNDISYIFPTIEEMVKDGLIIREMKEVSKNGISEGTKATYTLEDNFYNACFKFNKEHGRILEKNKQK